MTAPWEHRSLREHVDVISEGGAATLTWGGRFCWKNPLDLMIYQEIVFEVRPSLIIETGSHSGGSALFWRDMQRLAEIPAAFVVSVDVSPPPPAVDDVTFLTGSSVAPAIVSLMGVFAAAHETVLVNLDSDHSAAHVRTELDAYHTLVTPGSYLIVEDGIDDYRWSRHGPHAATVEWLAAHPEFEPDEHRERLGITNCPDGYLRRL